MRALRCEGGAPRAAQVSTALGVQRAAAAPPRETRHHHPAYSPALCPSLATSSSTPPPSRGSIGPFAPTADALIEEGEQDPGISRGKLLAYHQLAAGAPAPPSASACASCAGAERATLVETRREERSRAERLKVVTKER